MPDVNLAQHSSYRRLTVGQDLGPVDVNVEGFGDRIVLYRHDTIAVLESVLENSKLGLVGFLGISVVRNCIASIPIKHT